MTGCKVTLKAIVALNYFLERVREWRCFNEQPQTRVTRTLTSMASKSSGDPV